MTLYKNLPAKMKAATLLFTLVAITIIPFEPAYAQDALFDSGTSFLTALENLLTGTWARIIAVISVVFLGISWMTGRISWGMASSIIGGIILVFGATAIVDGINGAI